MTIHLPGFIASLLACACLSAAPAAAQVNVDVTASNLHFILFDLAPDDGETPWLRLSNDNLSPLSVSSSVTPSGSDQYVQDHDDRRSTFEFSANTRLALVLDVRTDMQALPLLTREQGGWAVTSFRAEASWGPPENSLTHYDAWTVDGDIGLYPLSNAYTTRLNREDRMWLTLENDSVYSARGEFEINLGTASYSNALPVPEAPAPAMLALGIGLLGLLKRRRAGARLAAWPNAHHFGPGKFFKLKP